VEQLANTVLTTKQKDQTIQSKTDGTDRQSSDRLSFSIRTYHGKKGTVPSHAPLSRNPQQAVYNS